MKHLFLSGGMPKANSPQAKQWVDALLENHQVNANIAFCFFALPEAEWQDALKQNVELVTDNAGSAKVEYKLLTQNDFTEVSAWANIVVLAGGDPFRLKNALEQFGNLMEIWDGKTIAG